MKKFLLLFGILIAFASCNTPKNADTASVNDAISAVEEADTDPAEEMDSEDETSDDPGNYVAEVYQATNRRTHDLIHTRLDLHFNWAEEKVIGKAELMLRPYFHASDMVTLDAKGFEFQKVSLSGKNMPLKYTYENDQITIQLDRKYTRQEQYSLMIEYTASPSASGGSDAITSNKGLFFINPRGEEAGKPMQIWTQGETNWNSRWFPTMDSPNERCTQEIYLTVEDRFKTLSNGLLLKQTKNADGTRTDYWKMDQPHAPYLFMIAVGEYAVVEDKWRNVPLQYYVEPAYEADAKAIFPYTPEMLEYFSKAFGYDYPWKKYAQIVVRDFVSGAMENTTAVTFGDFVQKHKMDLVDERTNEKIVAHEMMHHWFGDLVTCESWSNLTLNEGFANYSEYLWLENKYGRDEADYHLLEEWQGYFSSADMTVHPLIHFSYADNEDMFDAHSYNKGGSVLHMLRHYVGDEAFFAALKFYLDKHAYSAVEVHDLRLAFEEVTGEDLNWFFNQWFLKAGHPTLNVTYGYDAEVGKATVTVEQTQDPELMPAIFELPTAVDIYFDNGTKRREKIRVTERGQTFEFEVPSRPALMIFDPEKVLLCIREEEKSEQEYVFQYFNAPSLSDRMDALQYIVEQESEEMPRVFNAGLNDKFWLIRAVSTAYADFEEEPIITAIRKMAKSDPHSVVRREAMNNLQQWEDEEALLVARYILEKDSVNSVLAAALSVLAAQDPDAAMEYARKWENTQSEDILTIIGELYSSKKDPANLPFFERQLAKTDGFAALAVFGAYQSLLAELDLEQATPAITKIETIAGSEKESMWRRFAGFKFLVDMSNAYAKKTDSPTHVAKAAELKKKAEALRDAETDADMKGIYDQVLQGAGDE
jgi:aminopeptidase N